MPMESELCKFKIQNIIKVNPVYTIILAQTPFYLVSDKPNSSLSLPNESLRLKSSVVKSENSQETG